MRAEDPNSASSEFCKSKKNPEKYFFLALLTEEFNNRGKRSV